MVIVTKVGGRQVGNNIYIPTTDLSTANLLRLYMSTADQSAADMSTYALLHVYCPPVYCRSVPFCKSTANLSIANLSTCMCKFTADLSTNSLVPVNCRPVYLYSFCMSTANMSTAYLSVLFCTSTAHLSTADLSICTLLYIYCQPVYRRPVYLFSSVCLLPICLPVLFCMFAADLSTTNLSTCTLVCLLLPLTKIPSAVLLYYVLLA